MANRWWSSVNSERLYFLCSKITANGDYNHEIKRHLLLGGKAVMNLDSILKNRNITFPTKVHLVSYGFSSSHVWMWELDHKENWALKNWCFWAVLLEKTLESHLDYKEIKSVHPKGNQSWMFIGRMMLKLKLLYFGHLMWCTDSFEKTLVLRELVMNRGAWHAAVHGVTKSWTWLSDWTELNWCEELIH